MTRPLTNLQLAFCDEYLVDLNAAAAARRAGYAARSARQQASRLLEDSRVQERVLALLDRRRARAEVTQDEVVEELRRLAFTRITDLASWDTETMTFVASAELSEAAKSSLKKIKSKRRITRLEDGTSIETLELEIEQHPKEPALKALGAHLGMRMGTIRIRMEAKDALADMLGVDPSELPPER
jgi:phage terminase small subunit